MDRASEQLPTPDAVGQLSPGGVEPALSAEEALRISEERLHLVAQATTDTVWDWDVSANSLWWGGRFREMLGLPDYAGIPHPDAYAARLHPSDRKRVIKSLFATVQGHENTWECEYRIRHEDGHYLWVLDKGFVIRDAQGQAQRMVGGMADISERKLAAQEAELQARVHAELVRVLQKISSIDMALADVLQQVAQTAQDITQASGAMVEMVEGQTLVTQASVG